MISYQKWLDLQSQNMMLFEDLDTKDYCITSYGPASDYSQIFRRIYLIIGVV